MDDLIEKHQLVAKLFEFSSLQNLSDEQNERHSPFFRGQNKILVVLSEEDNISQKEIAKRLNLSSQSVTEFISKLVKKNLVIKTPSSTDKRIQLIKLTEKGRSQAEKSLFYIPDYIDYLTEDERKVLITLIDKLNEGIRSDLNIHGIQNLGTRIMLRRLDKKTDSDL